MLNQPTECVSEQWSIQTVIHTSANNGGITVYLVSGWITGQTQSSIVDPQGYVRARTSGPQSTALCPRM